MTVSSDTGPVSPVPIEPLVPRVSWQPNGDPCATMVPVRSKSVTRGDSVFSRELIAVSPRGPSSSRKADEEQDCTRNENPEDSQSHSGKS